MQESRRPNGTFTKGTSGNPKGKKSKDVVLPAQQIVPGTGVMDGFYSNTTGIGTRAYDKRLGHFFQPPCLTYQEAIELWAKSDLARRAIQDPIEDAFRQGWYLQIKDKGQFTPLLEAFNDKVLELQVDDRYERAICMERAVGGSVILIGANDNKPFAQPLKISEANGISWLTVLEPIEIVPYTFYKDVKSAKYGMPELYMLTSFTSVGELSTFQTGERAPPPEALIHESRLVVFGGIRVSKYQFRNSIAGSLWGEAMLTSIYEPLRDMEVAYHAASILATDVGQPAISIENLMVLVNKDPKALKARMLALENGRSTARAILLDTKEKLERQSGDQLAGVPDLLGALAIRYAASIPMPVSRLMSSSAAKAIGNEGTNELIYYYDDICAMQTRKIKPVMRPVLQMILQSTRQRGLPKRWEQKFHDLKRLSDAEKAEAHLTQARTDSLNIKAGMLTPDEARKSRFFGGYSFNTEVDESKKAPGFVAPPPHGTPGSPTNPGATGAPGKGAKVGLTQHAVGGYVRKNPTSKGEPAPKQGGDTGPRKDEMSQEDSYAIGQRKKMTDAGLVLSERGWAQMVDLWRQDYREHGAGSCDRTHCPLCQALSDGDGPGEMVEYMGFPIVIESPAGSVRYWIDTDGTTGETTMVYDYGYIAGAKGTDGDSVDVYLGPDPEAKWVYVMHQQKKPNFQEFDEDKVMLGFSSADTAYQAYVQQYDDERFFGGMSQIPLRTFAEKMMWTTGEKVTNADETINP